MLETNASCVTLEMVSAYTTLRFELYKCIRGKYFTDQPLKNFGRSTETAHVPNKEPLDMMSSFKEQN